MTKAELVEQLDDISQKYFALSSRYNVVAQEITKLRDDLSKAQTDARVLEHTRDSLLAELAQVRLDLTAALVRGEEYHTRLIEVMSQLDQYRMALVQLNKLEG